AVEVHGGHILGSGGARGNIFGRCKGGGGEGSRIAKGDDKGRIGIGRQSPGGHGDRLIAGAHRYADGKGGRRSRGDGGSDRTKTNDIGRSGCAEIVAVDRDRRSCRTREG